MAKDRASAAVDPVADLRDSEVDSLVQRVAQSLVVRHVWSAKDELTTATTSNTSGRFIVGGCYHEVLEVQVGDVEDAEVRVDVDVDVDVDAGSQQDEAANGPLPVTRTLGTDMSTMTWRVDRRGDCLLVAKQDNTARVARLEPDGEIVQTQSLTLGSPQHYVRGAPVLLTAPDGLKYPLAFMVGGWDSQATFYCADGPFSYRKAFEVHLGGTMSTGDWCRPAHAPSKLWFVVNVSSTAVVYEYDMESHTHDEVFRVGTNINGHGLVLTPEFVMVKASESVYVYSLRTRALEAVLPVDRYAESFRRVSQCSLGSPSSSYHMTMLGDTSVLLVSLSRVLMAVDVRTGAPLAFAPWKHSGSQAPYDVQVDGDAGLLYSVSTDRSHACYVYDVSPLLFHRNHQLAFVLGLNDPRTAVHRFGRASMFDRNLVKLVFSFVSSRLKFNST